MTHRLDYVSGHDCASTSPRSCRTMDWHVMLCHRRLLSRRHPSIDFRRSCLNHLWVWWINHRRQHFICSTMIKLHWNIIQQIRNLLRNQSHTHTSNLSFRCIHIWYVLWFPFTGLHAILFHGNWSRCLWSRNDRFYSFRRISTRSCPLHLRCATCSTDHKRYKLDPRRCCGATGWLCLFCNSHRSLQFADCCWLWVLPSVC